MIVVVVVGFAEDRMMDISEGSAGAKHVPNIPTQNKKKGDGVRW